MGPSALSGGGSSYSPPAAPEPETQQEDYVFRSPKQSVSVTYEDPSGKTKTVQTTAGRLNQDIAEMQQNQMRVVAVRPVGGQQIYKAETTGSYESRVKDYYKREYYEHGFIPSDVRKQVTIPESISYLGLGEQYLKASYEQSFQNIPKDFVGPVYDPFQKTFSQRYESLPSVKKFEYGLLFGSIPKTNIHEWQYYEGGKEYLSEHKETSIEQYVEQQGGWAKVYVDAYQYTSKGAAWSGKTPKDIGLKKERVWDILTLTPEQSQKKYFEALPLPAQLYSKAFYETVSAMPYPITLSQMGVKYVTGQGSLTDPMGRIQSGKTLILPDVGRFLSQGNPDPLGASGLIGTGISEGLTLGKSDAWERFTKDPLGGISATGGEILGMLLGGKVVQTAKAGIIKGLGYTSFIKYSPQNLLKRGYMRVFHKKASPETIFADTVISGKAKMDFTSGGPKALIEKFETVRNPLTGRIEVTHATVNPLKTTLRSRPSGLIYDAHGNLLLMQHDYLNTYLTVGGGKNRYELSISALSREAGEELGIVLRNPKKLFSFPDYSSGNLYTFFKSGYKGTPKLLGETTGYKLFDVGSRSYDDVLKAWHVKEAVKKLENYNFSSPDIIGKSLLFSYPDDFVIGLGTRTSSITGGLYVTPKGYLGDWALALRKNIEQYGVTSKTTLFKRSKPAILLTEVDSVVEMPLSAFGKRSVSLSDDFLKYSHKAQTGPFVKAYVTPKAYGMGTHPFETEAIIPSGTGMSKAKLGLVKTSEGIKDKWYNAVAKVTGYKQYTIVPEYGIPVPIRAYKPFFISDSGGKIVDKIKGNISLDKYSKLATKTAESLDDLSRGIIYDPVFSPSKLALFSSSYVGSSISSKFIPSYRPSYSPGSYPVSSSGFRSFTSIPSSSVKSYKSSSSSSHRSLISSGLSFSGSSTRLTLSRPSSIPSSPSKSSSSSYSYYSKPSYTPYYPLKDELDTLPGKRHYKGSDKMFSTGSLGYRYRDWNINLKDLFKIKGGKNYGFI